MDAHIFIYIKVDMAAADLWFANLTVQCLCIKFVILYKQSPLFDSRVQNMNVFLFPQHVGRKGTVFFFLSINHDVFSWFLPTAILLFSVPQRWLYV